MRLIVLWALPAREWSCSPKGKLSASGATRKLGSVRQSGHPHLFPLQTASRFSSVHVTFTYFSSVSTPTQDCIFWWRCPGNLFKTPLIVFLLGHLRGRKCLPEHKGESHPDPCHQSSTSELRSCSSGPQKEEEHLSVSTEIALSTAGYSCAGRWHAGSPAASSLPDAIHQLSSLCSWRAVNHLLLITASSLGAPGLCTPDCLLPAF